MSNHQSATRLVESRLRDNQRQAHDANLIEARAHRLSKAELLESLDRQIVSKSTWIGNFSTGRQARPAEEIRRARLQLAALVQSRDILAAFPEEQIEAATTQGQFGGV